MLGGVAHKPWRSREAEAALVGKPATEESFRRGRRGGARRMRSRSRTTPTRSSSAKRAIVRALMRAASWPDGRNRCRRYIGKEMSRVDGVAKVTGGAKYAAEFQVPNLALRFIVPSTIAQGHDHARSTRAGPSAPPACSACSRT